MSVSKRVKIQGVWKFKTAVEVDGRIVQHMVLVDGNVRRHPEGHYYYRLNEGKWVKLDACPESNKKARERVQVHPLPIEHGLISPLETGRTSSVRDAIEPIPNLLHAGADEEDRRGNASDTKPRTSHRI